MNDGSSYYDRYWLDAATAPPLHDPTTAWRKAHLARVLRRLRARRALDAGCGNGLFTRFIADLGIEAVGVDASARAIALARRQAPGIRFIAGDLQQAADEFPGAFDAVWSSEVIEHVFDTYGFLVALHRCLRDEGHLLLTTPYHGLLKNIAIDLANYAGHYNPFGGHIRFFNRASLSRCLRHCGFTPVQWKHFGRVWPFYRSFFVVARKTHEPAARPPADS